GVEMSGAALGLAADNLVVVLGGLAVIGPQGKVTGHQVAAAAQVTAQGTGDTGAQGAFKATAEQVRIVGIVGEVEVEGLASGFVGGCLGEALTGGGEGDAATASGEQDGKQAGDATGLFVVLQAEVVLQQSSGVVLDMTGGEDRLHDSKPSS